MAQNANGNALWVLWGAASYTRYDLSSITHPSPFFQRLTSEQLESRRRQKRRWNRLVDKRLEEASFDNGTLLVVEQSTLENRPRGVSYTPSNRVVDTIKQHDGIDTNTFYLGRALVHRTGM